MSHPTPRVLGEPIVQGSDYGLGLLASQETKDLFHNVKYATGSCLSTANKSIERSFCVSLDPCEFNNDNNDNEVSLTVAMTVANCRNDS